MLEKNKEQFPGFAGDGIKSKIHEFEGAHYYSVPPKYDFLIFCHFWGFTLIFTFFGLFVGTCTTSLVLWRRT